MSKGRICLHWAVIWVRGKDQQFRVFPNEMRLFGFDPKMIILLSGCGQQARHHFSSGSLVGCFASASAAAAAEVIR